MCCDVVREEEEYTLSVQHVSVCTVKYREMHIFLEIAWTEQDKQQVLKVDI